MTLNATDTTMIVPASVADVAGMLATAMNVITRQPRGDGGSAPPGPARPPGPSR